MLYDPQVVRAFYDNLGTREWERLEQTLQGRIQYSIHRCFLEKYVPEGVRVLDAGCGPGRYALDLARRGACLTLADISQVQLDQARQRFEAAGLLDRVQAFHRLDIVNMHELQDVSFDVVVCYGAALSYTCDQYQAALDELARVICPGGRLLISVNSLYGNLHLLGHYDDCSFLETPNAHMDWEAVLSGMGVIYTRPGSPEFHQPFVFFTSEGLRRALNQAGLDVIDMAAANPVVSERVQIPRITASAEASAVLTSLEVAICSKPGLVDTGEHLLMVADKP